jgi:hypothetical protein
MQKIACMESNFKLDIIGRNKDGSRDFGLFQINNKWHRKDFFAIKDWRNAEHNTDYAVYLWKQDKSRGGSGLRPWKARSKIGGLQ